MLEKNLQKVEQLVAASKWARFANHPLRYVYAQLFRHVFFPITKKGRIARVATFMGRPLSILLPSSADIYLLGAKTHNSELRLAKFLIKNVGTEPFQRSAFLDIGAHVGYFSALAATILGEKGRVVAVEAAKGTFDILQKNVGDWPGVSVRHNAISDAEGTLDFYEFPVLYSEFNALDVAQYRDESWFKRFKPEKITVNSTTIDALVRHFSLKNPIVKIDTEGAEAQAIAGATQTLQEQSPIVVMEFLADARKNATHHAALELLKAQKYGAHYLDDAGNAQPLADDVITYLSKKRLDSDNLVFFKIPTK